MDESDEDVNVASSNDGGTGMLEVVSGVHSMWAAFNKQPCITSYGL